MGSRSGQYVFALIFMAVGIYQLVAEDYLEFALYTLAGTTFVVNALSLDPRLRTYKKPLAIASWMLIIATGLLFLYLLQFKYF